MLQVEGSQVMTKYPLAWMGAALVLRHAPYRQWKQTPFVEQYRRSMPGLRFPSSSWAVARFEQGDASLHIVEREANPLLASSETGWHVHHARSCTSQTPIMALNASYSFVLGRAFDYLSRLWSVKKFFLDNWTSCCPFSWPNFHRRKKPHPLHEMLRMAWTHSWL